MKVPLLYQIILDWMYSESYLGKIEVRKARYILGHRYRIPKIKMVHLFNEMKDLGFIEFENHKNILIKIECCKDF